MGGVKNKDKYDLATLTVDIAYLTDGCGKKTKNLRYITVKNGKQILYTDTVNDNPMEHILRWLEQE